MKQNTALQEGNEWYQVTTQSVPYTVIDMRQRPIGNKKAANDTLIAPTKATSNAVKPGSKFAQAIELFNKSLSKGDMVDLIMFKLNMTQAGANTYYYKCKGHCV